MIKMAIGDPIFAQLLFLFKVTIKGKEYSLALIHAFDDPIPVHEHSKKDIDLGLFRLRAKPRRATEFIFIESIIRGALVVDGSEPGKANDKFVVDLIDTDMFLRLQNFH
jgi:hypothetical protein